jgi:hypothetical protein
VPSDDDPVEAAELRSRKARYEDAGPLGKAAMRITRSALTPAQRQQLRRHEIGTEGRIAEDVVRVVDGCEPVWSLIASMGLPEDLTISELNEIWECLLGRRPRGWSESNVLDVSLKFRGNPLHVAALSRVIPGTWPDVAFDAYRYATLTTPGTGAVEPFVLALKELDPPRNQVVATMLVAPTFLRHEEEIGVIDPADLEPLQDILGRDLAAVAETHAELRAASSDS